jgi:PilZ domain
MKTEERRSEPRIQARTPVVVTPLAAVATRLHGSVVNVSPNGVRVHFDVLFDEEPRPGDVYRIQSRHDLMLCEVRYFEVAGSGADLGLQIVHWGEAGELKRLIQDQRVPVR